MKNLWYALFLVALVTQAQAQNARVVEMQQLPPRNSFERRGVSLKAMKKLLKRKSAQVF